MTDQSKRGIAAVVLATCVVGAVCLLAIGRLAPDTFAPVVWMGLIGGMLGMVAIATRVLRTTKG